MRDLDILVLILININSLYIRVSLIVIDLFGELSVLDTNAIFTRLGAEDIVNRYDKLLNEWKMLKDAEREFKLIMGLEQEKDLVKCLGSIPPGNLFKTQFYFKRYSIFMILVNGYMQLPMSVAILVFLWVGVFF